MLISGFVALTRSPMMASRLLKAEHAEGRFARLIDGGFERLKQAYSRTLSGTLGMRPAVYAVWIVLTLAVVPLYMFSPAELAPNEDQGAVFGAIDAPANATLEQLTPFTAQVNQKFSSIPEFSQSFQITFPTGGFGGAIMKPWSERTRTIFDIQAELSQKTYGITGIRAPVFLPPALPSPGFFPVELVIASTASHDELVAIALKMVEEAAASGQFAFPPIMDVRIDQERAELVVDRDKVASLGVTMQSVANDMSSMLSGNFVNRFTIDGRS